MSEDKKKNVRIKKSPRVAHVDFMVEKEALFIQYVKYLSSPWHIMWRNFLAGTFRGVGFVLGTAALLTLIGFFTSQVLSSIPFFSDFAEAVNIWLESTLQSR